VSPENLEALRSLYAQFAEGKVWAAGELLAPDVVSSWPEPGGRIVCHGQDELRDGLRGFLGHWSDYRAEAREFDTVGEDSVLVVAQQYATSGRSGIEIVSPVFTVWTFRGGRVVGQHWALNRDEALEAAGIG
jgi:ketosteroid isomerase-like protein